MLVQPEQPKAFAKLRLNLPVELVENAQHYRDALNLKSTRKVTLDETVALLLDFAINKDADFKHYMKQLTASKKAGISPSPSSPAHE